VGVGPNNKENIFWLITIKYVDHNNHNNCYPSPNSQGTLLQHSWELFNFYHFHGMGGQMEGGERKSITSVLWKGAPFIGARTLIASMAIVMLIMNRLPILIMSLIERIQLT